MQGFAVFYDILPCIWSFVTGKRQEIGTEVVYSYAPVQGFSANNNEV